MLAIEDFSAAVTSGPGHVVRDPGMVLLIPAPTPEQLPLARRLIEGGRATGSAPDRSGRRRVRTIAGLIAAHEPELMPDFAGALQTDHGLVVLVHGAAQVVVHGATSTTLRGTDSLAWVEHLVHESVDGITLSGLPEGSGAAATPARLGSGLDLDLTVGAVPGSAVQLRARGSSDVHRHPPADGMMPVLMAMPVPAPRPMPVKAPVETPTSPATGPLRAQVPELVVVPVLAPVEVPSPTGLVEGSLCSREHFNDPQASYCATCGISMQQRSREIVRRPRPQLGVLVMDDGTSVPLDSGVVLGRDPALHPAVVSGEARPVVVNDDVNGVSRVHARIALTGWRVCITDTGSSNGTQLVDAQGTRTVGDEPICLATGSSLRIGRRSMTFHSYHSGGE